MIYRSILGNIAQKEWAERAEHLTVEEIALDQWTAQKSRFSARGNRGGEYAVALKRHSALRDGDVISYQPERQLMAVIRLQLRDVMVIDLGALANMEPTEIIHSAVDLGHAIGNQHWPAVVRGTEVYVPMTTDRRVMQSVMNSHHIEHIAYSFRGAEQIVPYLSPYEVRRLLGGTAEHTHHHHHADEEQK